MSTALRALLTQRFPDAMLAPERAGTPVATGLEPLDRILPHGGLPSGRVTVWQARGPEGNGATAMLRAAAFGLLARGERAAWVDGAGTLGPAWAAGPLVLRPESESAALRAAEVLLRSGGFALVVLTGVAPHQTAMIRLSRMVHEGGGALVAVSRGSVTASLRISSTFLPEGCHRARSPFGDTGRIDAMVVRLEARGSGWFAHTTVSLPLLQHDLRLSLAPGLADRRGALG